jgi:predicted PurR-regulated permease PerM
MDTIINKVASDAIIGIYRLLLFLSVMACLYFGQYILTPLALAGLFAFMLSPAVTFLENWLGRIVSILIVITLFGLFIGMVGYVITDQVVEFSERLPNYKTNIENKLNTLDIPQNKTFSEILATVDNLKNRLPGRPARVVSKGPSVNVIESAPSDITTIFKEVFTSLLNIIGSTGFVFLLVIVMLFAREDLRGRFIRLIGPRRISATTRAMQDASYRVTHYLIWQFLLNILFGIFIAVGLYCLGIPNAILWGGLAAILRFIPFFGAIIAAMIPVIVAFAISSGWSTPIFTLALFISLDLIIGHIIEPLFAGSATGISPLALIVSAVFWTLLWGPIGLLLSTPLTVCIVVMGRHIPKLAFLSVILGNEEALALYEECYQRLIAIETSEVSILINNHLKSNALTNVFDSIFIPILSAAETDRRNELLEDDQIAFLHQNIQEILSDIRNQKELIVIPVSKVNTNPPVSETTEATDTPKEFKVLCIPAAYEREELASIMLMEILSRLSFNAEVLSKYNKEDILAAIKVGGYDAVCVSLVAPYPITQARNLCAEIRSAMPETKLILGLWGMIGNSFGIEKKLKSNKADSIVSSLTEAVAELDKFRFIKYKTNPTEEKDN